MLILLAPAKRQNIGKEILPDRFSQPAFLKEANDLIGQLRRYAQSELSKILHINPKLAEINLERLHQWQMPFTPENAKQAAWLFDGDAYQGLNIRRFTDAQQPYIQQHLLLFSGLYGLLRPFDLIQPYRLDVGDSFKPAQAVTLYAFWQKKLTDFIDQRLMETDAPDLLLNLASNEYWKIIDAQHIKARIIHVDFLQEGPQGLRNISTHTKKARGQMAAYVLEHQIKRPEELIGFTDDGYAYRPHASTELHLVFAR